MKRVAIVGVGGIGSWVVEYLKEIVDLFDRQKLIYVKLFDKDEVEEKNLLRSNQNFEIKDLMQQKAEVLAKRFGFDYEVTLIEENNTGKLDNFDDIILCVDNNKTRRMIYKYCIEMSKYLVDLKAQGTQLGFNILDNNKKIEYYDKTIFKNKEIMERKGSCQLEADIEKDHIENANKIIAFFGVYGIYLKRLRGETVTTNDWKFVY